MILVTGATGHVGANLVRALIERGERVRVMARADRRGIEGLDIEIVEGDLRHREDVARAVKGVRRIYHLAAYVSLRAADRQMLFDVNVLGTRKVMMAALEAGVERVVHCSSFGAIGRAPNGGVSDETFTLNPAHVELEYEASKALAEHEVLRAALAGLDVTIVNPSGIVGGLDFKPSSVGQTTLDFCHGRMPAYVPGAFEFVAVDDVVSGHLLAMEKGKKGERYILTGEHRSLGEVLTWLEEITGVRKPRIALSPAVMERVAVVKDWVEKTWLPHRAPRFTRDTIRLLNSGKRGTNEKARTELGWQPTSLRDAFAQQARWFAEQGQLPPHVAARLQAPV